MRWDGVTFGGPVLDLAGFAIFGGLVGWVILAAVASGGDPASLAGLVAVSSMGLLLGRLAGRRSGILVPATIGVAAVLFALQTPWDLIDSGPTGGPFGYANATGAYFAQAGIAAVIIATTARGDWLRVAGWAAAVGFTGVVIGSRSSAASFLLIVFPAIAVAISRWGRPRVAVAVFAALFSGAVVATLLVGAGYPSHTPGLVDDAIAGTVGERRAVLWRDAMVIMGAEPFTGAGIGGFQLLSPTARSDADSRWAHNEFLEMGAETGVPGLVLLVLVFVWAFARLWVAPDDVITALGAAAVAAIGIHASIDYVMHFPAIPIAAAALVGAAMSEEGESPANRASDHG